MCGCNTFVVTWHVAQEELVDGNGNYLETVTECSEVDHEADDEDIWTCSGCGYADAGSAFNG